MTEISKEILKSDKKIQYDDRIKSFLANKRILARILAETIEDFKGKTIDEIVLHIEEPAIGSTPVDPGATNNKAAKIKGINTESSEIDEGLIRFDILFYVTTPNGRSQIIVNIEAQKDKPEKYSLLNRAIFYESRLISSQKDRDFFGSNYDDIKRTYSIWLCMNQKESSLLHYQLTKNSVRGCMTVKGDPNLYNIIIAGIPERVESKDEGTLFGFLGVALSRTMKAGDRIRILKDKYDENMAEGQEGDVNTMCNLSEGIFEEGKAEGKVEVVMNLLSMTDLSVEKISQISGICIEEIEKIKEKN